MSTYWRSGGDAARILNLGSRWRWLASFTPRPLCLRGKSLSTNWTGGWVGPRAGLDALVRRKNSSPYREKNPGCPARSLVTVLTGVPWLKRIPNSLYWLFCECVSVLRLCQQKRKAQLCWYQSPQLGTILSQLHSPSVIFTSFYIINRNVNVPSPFDF
jgi:hypothetical protein